MLNSNFQCTSTCILLILSPSLLSPPPFSLSLSLSPLPTSFSQARLKSHDWSRVWLKGCECVWKVCEASGVGHCWSGEVPCGHQKLLSWCCRSTTCLRHLKVESDMQHNYLSEILCISLLGEWIHRVSHTKLYLNKHWADSPLVGIAYCT